MNQIVAVVGMCGSGKSVITNYLEDKGWARVYEHLSIEKRTVKNIRAGK